MGRKLKDIAIDAIPVIGLVTFFYRVRKDNHEQFRRSERSEISYGQAVISCASNLGYRAAMGAVQLVYLTIPVVFATMNSANS